MSSASSSTTPVVVTFTSTRDPSSTWPVVTGSPTAVQVSSASPPGPTCTANGGCGGSMCQHFCNSCGPLGCGGGINFGGGDGLCLFCLGTGNPSGGGSRGPCVGAQCPKPSPSEDTDDDSGGDDPTDDDICQPDVNTATGLCLNGNFPVWDAVAGIVSCDHSAADAPDYMTACQEDLDDDLAERESEAQDSHDCCPAAAARGASLLDGRAPACPPKPNSSSQSTSAVYQSVFTCDYRSWPNVCANAKSAIDKRGKSPLMTYPGPQPRKKALHITNPWYSGKFASPLAGTTGWGLADCEVEEYPWGSSNPNRKPNWQVWSEQSVLRLIPKDENGKHGTALQDFYRAAGNGKIHNAKGLVFSVSFVNGPTGTTDKDYYLDENDQGSKDINICAQPYGVPFLLVGVVKSMNPGESSYDPWWNSRLFTKTTNIQTNRAGSTTLIESAARPSQYCQYPSPGRKKYDDVNSVWQPVPGAVTLPRKRGNLYYSCDNFAGYTGPAEMRRALKRGRRRGLSEMTGDEIDQMYAEGRNISISDGRIQVENRHTDPSDNTEDDTAIISVPETPRSPGAPPPRPGSGNSTTVRLSGQRRSLTPRQAAAGSFLDPSAFDYLGCGNSDMDWCALPGADCYTDNDVADTDPDDDDGSGSGTSPPTSTSGGGGGGSTPTSAPPSTYTWRIGIYSEKGCSGDYYSLEGHNLVGSSASCIDLRGSDVKPTSDPSCGWYTNGGGTRADCSTSALTNPQSWQLLSDSSKDIAVCTVYNATQCSSPPVSSNDWNYDSRGCQDFTSGDAPNWVSIQCGVEIEWY
ncbi:hypothetical protein CONLIGDRAFT_26583 [Coniochaeta ligniaria NRRL 30616]|uniref:Secreted LysM effector LysM C-terminal domain-containing protein n=1 Tax=Coniochaeta ligniaria NRRL 30616 TaxID=1408157 RepID=A0A1J7JN38_9PEZI|nr:hypothetical protein CONLIGDRAFT_26583 [Coniochaeta ligniaria NRRL 30616]